jgi:hypothetical protein
MAKVDKCHPWQLLTLTYTACLHVFYSACQHGVLLLGLELQLRTLPILLIQPIHLAQNRHYVLSHLPMVQTTGKIKLLLRDPSSAAEMQHSSAPRRQRILLQYVVSCDTLSCRGEAYWIFEIMNAKIARKTGRYNGYFRQWF